MEKEMGVSKGFKVIQISVTVVVKLKKYLEVST